MKKLSLMTIGLLIIASAGSSFAKDPYYVDYTPTSVTSNGVLTNSFSYTVSGNREVQILALYQDVTSTTNTAVITVLPSGQSTAYTAETLSAVNATVALETVGAGDVSADIDDIWLLSGDTITVTGTGTNADDVEYVLRMKQKNQ